VSRTYPALDITPQTGHPDTVDLILALVDDDRPFAVEEHDDTLRVFFTSDATRATSAARLLDSPLVAAVVPVDVPDDDWAVKGQPALQPVEVGRLVIVPAEKNTSGMFFGSVANPAEKAGASEKHTRRVFLCIPPSMGFGTGHHASTRLCLAMLQQLPLDGRRVLDVGTGSGILAIAAAALGASSALGIDYDADALTAAAENVARNDAAPAVTLGTFDLDRQDPRELGTFEIVLANLTGGHLEQRASPLAAFVAPGGYLVASGFQVREAGDVQAALAAAGLALVTAEEEEGWMAALFVNASPTASTAR
jgi:ribosomal protein L11 methyltransferase